MSKNTLFSYFSPSPKVKVKKNMSSDISSSPVEHLDLEKKENVQNNISGSILSTDKLNIKLGILVAVRNSDLSFSNQIGIVSIDPTSERYVKYENGKTSVHVRILLTSTLNWLDVNFLTQVDETIESNISSTNMELYTEYCKFKVLPENERLQLIGKTCDDYNEEDVPKRVKRKLVVDEDDLETSELSFNLVSNEGIPSSQQYFSSFSSPLTKNSKQLNSPEISQKKRKSIAFDTPSKQNLKLSQFNFGTPDSSFTDPDNSFVNEDDSTIESVSPTMYPHHSYEFLQENKIRDANKRLKSHKDYDPSTLYVPGAFLESKEVTPAMKQWWKFKSENFDAVIFFKMGKFYELFHMDADIAVRELALLYMKGNYAHSGFPEGSFPQYSGALVSKGYRVVRVEQTETPGMLSERLKSMPKSKAASEKVVSREVCSIVTSGTRILDAFDLDGIVSSNIGENPSLGGLILCVTQSTVTESQETTTRFGVCALDASTGHFTVSEFDDNCSFSDLRTFLAELPLPVLEVVLHRNFIQSKSLKVLKSILSFSKFDVIVQSIPIETEEVMKQLISKKYFTSASESCEMDSLNYDDWPEILKRASQTENIPKCRLMFSAFAIMLHVLRRSLIDYRILSLKSFSWYQPHVSSKDNCMNFDESVPFSRSKIKTMILDESAITNLDVLSNTDSSVEASSNSSILGLLNHCQTAFGRRLLPQILCRPLCDKQAIDDRLNALDDLMNLGDIQMHNLQKKLSQLPDLERLLFKLHALGALLIRETDHPENRAVIFNQAKVDRIRIDHLLATLDGFRNACGLIDEHVSHPKNNLKSSYLKNLLDENSYKIVSSLVDEFLTGFDYTVAKNEAIVLPKAGFIPEFDHALQEMTQLVSWFDNFIFELKSKLNLSGKVSEGLKFIQSGKCRYILEVSDSVSQQQLEKVLIGKDENETVEFLSQRKGFHRFNVGSVQKMLQKLILCEQVKEKALKNSLGLLLVKISKHFSELVALVKRLAMLDVLLSFAHFATSFAHGPLCRPEIVNSPTSMIHLTHCYHPCVAASIKGTTSFVPNDVYLGGQDSYPTTMIITGPNMGGKSTLMRQVAICVLLSHIGCYVPAKSCKLTLVDRIFARLGASFDRPQQGQSTFYVELAETSTMLRSATPRSLAVLDELGRGTSTSDGQAIASSVLRHLANTKKCITLFSTHYHSLVSDVFHQDRSEGMSSVKSSIGFAHMACDINEDEMCCDETISQSDSTSTFSNKSITFLYELRSGVCPKSYGFFAAKLAGISLPIIQKAMRIATECSEKEVILELLSRLESKHSKNIIPLLKRLAIKS